MSGRVEWQAVSYGEQVLRYADFTDELASGETVASATATCTVWSGNDADPSAAVGASTIINNATGLAAVAQIEVVGGVLGTIYQVVVQATTSAGRKPAKTAYLAIVPDAP